MKTHICLSVDIDVINIARKLNINISELCQKSLEAVISFKTNDKNIDVIALNREADLLRNEIIDKQAKLNDIGAKIAVAQRVNTKESKKRNKDKVKMVESLKRGGWINSIK